MEKNKKIRDGLLQNRPNRVCENVLKDLKIMIGLI